MLAAGYESPSHAATGPGSISNSGCAFRTSMARSRR